MSKLLLAKSVFLILFLSSVIGSTDEGVKHESELGITIVEANRDSESWNAKQQTTYEWRKNLVRLNASYLRAESEDPTTAQSVESARAWLAGVRYERILNTRLNAFVGYQIEADINQSYIQKSSADAGAKYFLAKSKPTTWFIELGYRSVVSLIPNPTREQTAHALRAYTEFNQELSDTATTRFFVEYIPNIQRPNPEPLDSNQNGYVLTVEPSISVRISNNLTVKSAYNHKTEQTTTSAVNITKTFTTNLLVSY